MSFGRPLSLARCALGWALSQHAMLVQMQVAVPPPRTALGVYVDGMALVAECLHQIVALVERELMLQAKVAPHAAAPQKTVLGSLEVRRLERRQGAS